MENDRPHIEILKDGIQVWNQWRREHPEITPDLRSANLRFADLRSANLRSADLRSANLRFADLRSANLRSADLSDADLRSANLSDADLRSANLSDADLRSANLDFSCWPLWCGSKDVNINKRIAAQLAAHFCVVKCDDEEVIAAQAALMDLAKQSHRASDLGLSDAAPGTTGGE